jgi:hypothetical protein
MVSPGPFGGLGLAGEVIGVDFEGWDAQTREEFVRYEFDGHVGSRLLSENARVRVWEIGLAPNQYWHAHRHVLDYFWTAITPGVSIQHTADGATRRVRYEAGETRHFHFGPGEYLLHDIRNVADTELRFVTVEHLESDNSPLPL